MFLGYRIIHFASHLVQGPIDYKLYEAYGGGVGKAVSAVLNNVGATRAALGVLAGIVVRHIKDDGQLSAVCSAAVTIFSVTSGLRWPNLKRSWHAGVLTLDERRDACA